MVEGAALEMLCPERDLGFESLTLRQSRASTRNSRSGLFFLFSSVPALTADIYFINVSQKLLKTIRFSRAFLEYQDKIEIALHKTILK